MRLNNPIPQLGHHFLHLLWRERVPRLVLQLNVVVNVGIVGAGCGIALVPAGEAKESLAFLVPHPRRQNRLKPDITISLGGGDSRTMDAGDCEYNRCLQRGGHLHFAWEGNMAEQVSIALPDGSFVGLPDANWTTLVSAGISDNQKLRVLKHSDGRQVMVYGQVGKLAQGEIVAGQPRREEIEVRLQRVCTKLELPVDLIHSCLQRLPVRV